MEAAIDRDHERGQDEARAQAAEPKPEACEQQRHAQIDRVAENRYGPEVTSAEACL